MDPIWKSLNLAPGLGRSENDLGTDGTWFVVGLGSSHACDAIVTLAMQYIQTHAPLVTRTTQEKPDMRGVWFCNALKSSKTIYANIGPEIANPRGV